MPNSFGERLQHAWNAFVNNEANERKYVAMDLGYGSMIPSGKYSSYIGTEKSIINSIYTRMSMDVAAIDIYEARTDDNGNPVEKYKSGLTECLTVEANIDQTGRAFLQEIAMQMFEEGYACIVPTDTDLNPALTDSYDIKKARTGIIKCWYPEHVRVEIYNEKLGQRQEVTLPKKNVAIIQNPLYSIMNEPNSTLKRLTSKLSLMDIADQQSTSNKFNMIIQLPYVVKSEARKLQADARRKEIEDQLVNSKYGIAYTDGTEKIQQLSRPIENNFLQQIQYLTDTLYEQLGITKEILNGTANEQTMLNYYNHTIEPIAAAIADELTRKFLTKTARTQNRSVVYMRDPFKLVPVNNIAEIADKFTRNEILSSNEIRCIIGFKPSNQEGADDLRNKNLYAENGTVTSSDATTQASSDQSSVSNNQNGSENSEDDSEELDMGGLSYTAYQNTFKQIQDNEELISKLQSRLSGSSLKHWGTGQYKGTKGDPVYSTKYYDPEYSHDYYEKHKKVSLDTTDDWEHIDGVSSKSSSGSGSTKKSDKDQNQQSVSPKSISEYNVNDAIKNTKMLMDNYQNDIGPKLTNIETEMSELKNDENSKVFECKLNSLKSDNDMYKEIFNLSFDKYKKHLTNEVQYMNEDNKMR